MEFKEKVVIVTGSSAGIGKATAIDFARHGAKVVINGRNAERIEKVRQTCTSVSPFNYEAFSVVADLTKDEDMRRLISETVAHFGQLDVLVNNAGYTEFRTIDDADLVDMYEVMYRTNLRPTLYLTQLAIPHLAKTKGNVVNISSNSAIRAEQNMIISGMLDMSKDMFTQTAAVTLGPRGIRINSVRPGWTQTDTTDSMGLDFENFEALKSQPIKKIGRAEHVAHCVTFLAAPQSEMITGELLQADGGLILVVPEG